MSLPMPDRRRFIRDITLGGLIVGSGVGLTACGGSGGADIRFEHGVASGDPLADRVVLWTRVSGVGEDVEVAWEVARDATFTNIVAAGNATAAASRDFTVKVDATGLTADTRYHYRFRCQGVLSPTGRTRTLPTGTVEQIRLAVISCSNFPAGYFHVYRELARLDDAHATLHLGDYIYEYGRDGYASEDAATLGRLSEPADELVLLEDYRRRYAQYRGDADLQAFHASMPMIAVWDDHEIANDAWMQGAENHDPATEGSFAARKAAALQAWHEWLPVRAPDATRPERIYRRFAFGDLLALHMLDTRIVGRDQPLDYARFFGADGSFDSVTFAAAMADPNRQLLGEEQLAWLQAGLAGTPATWQVLGQQVLIGRMQLPAPVALQQVGFSAYAEIAARAQRAPDTLTDQERAILAQPAVPYNLDAWDGYAVARETVFGTTRALDCNLVVLSGDTHNAWANELSDIAGNPIGVEFATSSVSSPGLEEYLKGEDPDAVAAGVVQMIAPLKYANTSDRGYLLVDFGREACRAEWRFVTSVKQRSYEVFTGAVLHTYPGGADRGRIVA